ncbi:MULTISPECIES: L,D-transpeptidase family protein [unclassified Streptomyces]|uniref:L,D-transpeptidase family protein n=1 Tax=unclassified Streptomyces TaxID=2593676 RepID=UPI002DD84D5B|nr:L,D-transpeptidase family protein [Streptomyces sp. NBC_01788]WSB24912.1 L,D-transpeptidase family protein [Streptomyces sp. NBC_01788]
MRKGGALRTAAVVAVGGALAMSLTACGGTGHRRPAGHGGPAERTPGRGAFPSRVQGIGDRMWHRVPSGSRQVVAVHGAGPDSPDATVEFFTKHGSHWERAGSWPAHNGRKGWTTDHHEGDQRTPVGVFTLSDAGGVLENPGAKLPYTRSAAFQAPRSWTKNAWHDFDYVIAIDFNRVKGTPPNDPTRPQGQSRGGGIWLHMDHGSGTSACVTLSESAMRYLLRSLDPRQRPVVVMGDKADLQA